MNARNGHPRYIATWMDTDQTYSASKSITAKRLAREVGFDLCGVARAEALDPGPLDRWIESGMQADLEWMKQRREDRLDPARLVAGARSVVSLAVNYYSPTPTPPEKPYGKVSRYAWGRDYHNVLVKWLRRLRRRLEEEIGGHWYTTVDAGPVMEKAWAERAGIGWIGKNGCLLTTQFGSWVLLATLITTVELEPDRPHPQRCGTCVDCIRACPTDAIPTPGTVDARKCIAFHTIESRAEAIPVPLSGWIFGCDICQDVCPWNRKVVPTTHAEFAPKTGHTHIDLEDAAAITDEEFFARYTGTPIARARPEGMRRNARSLLDAFR